MAFYQLHNEQSLMARVKAHIDDPTFQNQAISFLFCTPGELRGYLEVCDINCARESNRGTVPDGLGSYGISNKELKATHCMQATLYFALQEHIRRKRDLPHWDFVIGEFEADADDVNRAKEIDVRLLKEDLDTRARS